MSSGSAARWWLLGWRVASGRLAPGMGDVGGGRAGVGGRGLDEMTIDEGDRRRRATMILGETDIGGEMRATIQGDEMIPG